MNIILQILFFSVFSMQIVVAIDSPEDLHNNCGSIAQEGYYVSAKSGLNYRDAPRGKKLGTFILNTYVQVAKHTGIFEEITDGGKVLKGEWLGVLKNTDTVYVHSAFLSTDYTYSDLEIYFASPYYKDEQGVRQAFVNMSEAFPWEDSSMYNSFIDEQEIGKDTITFSSYQKQRLLKSLKILETDNIYIYNFQEDKVTTYPIKNTPMMACVNIYAQGSDRLEILDYEIGFNLGKKYRTSGDNFVYIGATNPFQTGKVQTLNWKKTDSNNFPKLNGNDYINYDASWFEESSLENTYYATMGNYTYYIQEWTLGEYAQQRYLVVVDSVSNEIIHGSYQVDTESTYLLPLITSDKPMDNTNQWTGSLFKNRPPIIYGFVSNTFGCPDVLFLGYKEPPIAIKCDNRH